MKLTSKRYGQNGEPLDSCSDEASPRTGYCRNSTNSIIKYRRLRFHFGDHSRYPMLCISCTETSPLQLVTLKSNRTCLSAPRAWGASKLGLSLQGGPGFRGSRRSNNSTHSGSGSNPGRDSQDWLTTLLARYLF